MKYLTLITVVFLIFSFAEESNRGSSASDISENDKTKLQTPLQNFFKNTDWGYFYKEFELSFDPGFCGKGLDRAIGLKSKMVEPIGYFETTRKALYFPFADLDLGKGSYSNVVKAGSTRSSIREESGRDEFTNSHFIYAPIMGMIFKKKIPIFCFSNADLSMPFLSEFFPPYKKDIIFKNLIGPMATMFTPQGLMSTFLNCSATVGMEMIHGGEPVHNETVEKYTNLTSNSMDTDSLKTKGDNALKFIRNSMFYTVGCHGFAPIGGFIPAQDPNIDAELLLYSTLNILHGASAALPAPFLYKQTNFGMNGGKNGNGLNVVDSMCSPKKYATAIESQYTTQLVYPTVGTPHELGAPPMQVSVASNVPGSKDSVVFLVWQRRDYFAFAYQCPGN